MVLIVYEIKYKAGERLTLHANINFSKINIVFCMIFVKIGINLYTVSLYSVLFIFFVALKHNNLVLGQFNTYGQFYMQNLIWQVILHYINC